MVYEAKIDNENEKEVNWHSLTGGEGEGLEKYVKNEQDRRFPGLGGKD